ncbi:MAG: ECF-type sigma factor, partial [Planctomycetota bacterium]
MSSERVTTLLGRWTEGDENALHDLIPLVYDELRKVAKNRLATERSGHSLAPTDLVHEAYVRLVQAEIPWRNRVHFFAVAAGTMRRVLVDRARSRFAEKRGGDERKVALRADEALKAGDPETMLAL